MNGLTFCRHAFKTHSSVFTTPSHCTTCQPRLAGALPSQTHQLPLLLRVHQNFHRHPAGPFLPDADPSTTAPTRKRINSLDPPFVSWRTREQMFTPRTHFPASHLKYYRLVRCQDSGSSAGALTFQILALLPMRSQELKQPRPWSPSPLCQRSSDTRRPLMRQKRILSSPRPSHRCPRASLKAAPPRRHRRLTCTGLTCTAIKRHWRYFRKTLPLHLS